MGIFGQKPKFAVSAPQVRVEKVVAPKTKPRPLFASSSSPATSKKSARSSASPRVALNGRGSKSASPLPQLSSSSADGSEERLERKRKLVARNARAPAKVEFEKDESDEEDEAWEHALNEHKRKRRNGADDMTVDLQRKLKHSEAFGDSSAQVSGEAPERTDESFKFIHAADVASLALGCTPALKLAEEDVAIELQYPGAQERERHQLVKGKDKIDAVSDIIEIVKRVAENYLADSELDPFLNPTSGIIRQLERTSSPNVCDAAGFRTALDDYNIRIASLHRSGAIAEVLDTKHGVPLDLVQLILRQVYDRTVAPKVELLTKYQNGSDNVYGELNAPFSNDILIRRTRMTSSQVFVDLGSGVGNVVLQAALQIGCESWGCEMMENACAMAEAQLREFRSRCRLWGLAHGEVHLERGDFRTNTRIHDALKRADVVLVNNQAFTSQLNDDLVRMFLDLKSGCRIVSLKSFVHEHKGSSHNVNDVGSTILDVEDFTYPEGYVSWTGAGGTYCVSTRR
jgi:[histone H3]-lysine79 N-trimethyltransferase